jgi:hypothetical protein
VVGMEPGLVSCGVMGLLTLLRPLTWVAPIIPVLPLKHLDFIESPVPIVAGLVLEPYAATTIAQTSNAGGTTGASSPYVTGSTPPHYTPLDLLERCE